MKSKINLKSLLAGILIGAGIMGTANVFASLTPNKLVQAWLQDGTHKIMINGRLLDLGADNHIISYQGRIYTPVRLVSEAIGAQVDWNELTNTVSIDSPEPEIVEVEVEKIVYVDSEKKETKEYEEIPTRTTKSNVTFRVVGSDRHSNDFELRLTIENDSKYFIYPNVEKIYVEDEAGEVYPAILDGTSNIYKQGLDAGKTAENIAVYFKAIPRDVKNLKVVMPVEYEKGSGWNYTTEELTTFTTYIELEY